DLLRRRQTAQHLLAHRAVADAVNEGLDDLEIDVGLEQCEPNLAQRRLNQVFSEPPLSAEGLENVLQACAEGVKHWPLTCSSANAYRSGRAAGVSNRVEHLRSKHRNSRVYAGRDPLISRIVRIVHVIAA